jgi:hypothetical protein
MTYKRGKVYWYKFVWQGKLIRESTKQGNDKVLGKWKLFATDFIQPLFDEYRQNVGAEMRPSLSTPCDEQVPRFATSQQTLRLSQCGSVCIPVH